jgi:hypothetical protein
MAENLSIGGWCTLHATQVSALGYYGCRILRFLKGADFESAFVPSPEVKPNRGIRAT